MRRVSGTGGVFRQGQDPAAWCASHKTPLGIDGQAWGGAALRWEDGGGHAVKGSTAWSSSAGVIR